MKSFMRFLFSASTLVICSTLAQAQSSASAPIIFTVAGAPLGASGLATSTGLGDGQVVSDNAGNIYISDSANYVVRKVDSEGIISIVAGNGFPPGTKDA